MRAFVDGLLRLLGADPEVFRPVFRVQTLLVRRRSRLAINRRGAIAKLSPFRMLCFFAALYGVFAMSFAVMARVPMLGFAIAAAIGCIFLLLVVFTDYLDVLVDPREYLVLAAHPHDGRSILLAKMAAVGRSLAILAAFLFTPTAIVISFGVNGGSPAQALAYFAGSLAAGATASALGLFVGVTLLTLGGRRLMDRLLPFVQIAFQLAYLGIVGGQTLVRSLTAEKVPASVPWLLPTFWFLAPFEALRTGLSEPVALRGGLAALCLGLLGAGATRWLGSRFGERLLEPIERRPAVEGRRPGGRRKGAARPAGSDRGQLFKLLRVHLRSDWKTRSEFLVMPLSGVFLILFYTRGPALGRTGPGMVTFFFGWFLLLAVDVLTRSSRPAVLWCVLVSPVDRGKLSFAAVSLVRWAQLLPLSVLLVALEVFTGQGPALPRVLRLAELVVFGDLLILLGRGLIPDFPFSRSSRTEGQNTGRRTVVLLWGALAASVGTALITLAAHFGTAGMAVGTAFLLSLRVLAARWARRRVAEAAEAVEWVDLPAA